MKKDLYIVGAGSVGGHISLNINTYSEGYVIRGFFDDDEEKIGSELFGYNVIGPVNKVKELKSVSIAIGIAFPSIKRKIIEILSVNRTLEFPSLIHERSWISENVTIGKGSVIYPGTSINYGSKIGNFVVMNMNCALGHHTTVGDYSSLAPGVCTGGHTVFGEEVDVGIGASTIQDLKIGNCSIIGGNSMLINDVSPNSKVAGVPARLI